MSLPEVITKEEDVAELLSAEGHNVSQDEIAAIFDFLQQCGSIEKAQEAIEGIGELKRAA
jgi:hypothetical protein